MTEFSPAEIKERIEFDGKPTGFVSPVFEEWLSGLK
jgi:hypothetical protein